MNHDLQAALQLAKLGELRFAANVPDHWQQGRGAFGGLVLAILARAMEQAESDPERPLQSLSGEIVAPVLASTAEIQVEILRRGSGLSSVAARLRQYGELRAHASAIFGKSRVTDRERVSILPPTIPDWRSIEPLQFEPELAPPFLGGFEIRPTGPMPFTGNREPLTEGFVWLRERPKMFGAAELIAYVDAWWPTQWSIEEAPRPMATVAFSFQRCMPLADIPTDVPLFHRARGLASHAGYAPELRELWTIDGRLVALNPQTFCIIR